MLELANDLSPALAATMIAASAWFVRMQANGRNGTRARQLEQATELLRQHTASLEFFLDHPTPSDDLKRLLMRVSDAMADRSVAEKFIIWAAGRPFEADIDTEESRAVEEALASLQRQQPALADVFSVSLITAVAAASLRWPETAALFERAFPRLAARPKRDVTIAVTAMSLRRDTPSSVKPMATAIA
jgi:hypothetical protein